MRVEHILVVLQIAKTLTSPRKSSKWTYQQTKMIFLVFEEWWVSI